MIWSFIMISPSLHDMSVVFMLLFGGGWNWLRRRVRPKLRAGLCDPRWGRGGIKKSRISAAKMIKMASYGSWLLKVCGSIGMKIWLGPRFSRSTTPGASWMGFWDFFQPIQSKVEHLIFLFQGKRSEFFFSETSMEDFWDGTNQWVSAKRHSFQTTEAWIPSALRSILWSRSAKVRPLRQIYLQLLGWDFGFRGESVI